MSTDPTKEESKTAHEENKGDGTELDYHIGFGNHFASEALEGALPQHRNNPQQCNYGLYAEQLSGTPFTYPRAKMQRTWLYRIMPTVTHSKYRPSKNPNRNWISSFDRDDDDEVFTTPAQMRWQPVDISGEKHTFVEGIQTMCGAGGPMMKAGISMGIYTCNTSMVDTAFFSSDGDILIVPQLGQLDIMTEFGQLKAGPKEIIVIPRGIKFAVTVEEECRGYYCELYDGHFTLPDLGLIGTNGNANPRDFEYPKAKYHDEEKKMTVTQKYLGKFFEYSTTHSIFDVVAWHGNYLPYKYDCNHFNTMGSISYDHPDPSIFTVLTCQTTDPGQAACDFVIFTPRWLAMEDTFRPPYYHRNTMNEFMGNIAGTYDAKEKGFIPGAASLHSCMSAHGPEAEVVEKASSVDLKPTKVGEGCLAFMFETCYTMKIAKNFMHDFEEATEGKDVNIHKAVDDDYYKCWKDIKRLFDPNNINAGYKNLHSSS